MKDACGLLLGSDIHHLDHIAPLCDFLHIPLVVTEETMIAWCEEFYPGLFVRYEDPTTFTYTLLTSYEVVFTCLPRQLIDPLFYFDEQRLRKKVMTFWIPHGQSDKDNLSALNQEKLALVYGKQMLELFQHKGITDNLFKAVVMGNFRRHYYELHKSFLQPLIDERVRFPKEQKTLFYGPTWNEPATQKNLSSLLDNLPSDLNLMIKLHPNTLQEGFAEPLLHRASAKENVALLTDIPTIYPILEKADIYIGDHSSIAYDFLSFDRPLYFLSKQQTAIHHAGEQTTADELFKSILRPDSRQEARKEIYSYAFDQSIPFDQLPDAIEGAFRGYHQEGLHLL